MPACVYTVLIGGYEQLNEQPVALDSSMEFVCFTDDRRLKSGTWQIRHVTPLFETDPVRSQRALKIRAHTLLPDHDTSLYIDNSLILKRPAEEIFERLLTEHAELAAFEHSFRATVADEFEEVIRAGKDARHRCEEQLSHYRSIDPAMLGLVPLKGFFLLRRHQRPAVVEAMETWYAHVLRYSRRDQLSFWFALRRAGVEPVVHRLDSLESPYHRWPVARGRAEGPGDGLWTPPDEELDEARGELQRARLELQATHSTRSWRWTGPARALSRTIRR